MSAQRRVPTPSPQVLKVLDLAARLLYYAREAAPPDRGLSTPRPPRRHAHLRLAAVRVERADDAESCPQVGTALEPPEPPNPDEKR